MSSTNQKISLDVALIGGGIMSATLGTFLNHVEPGWSIGLFENLDRVGIESSQAWNNAGTGHSALCELNYSPQDANGKVDPTKAVSIAEQFQQSRQFYTWLVEQGIVQDPQSFIHALPHSSFVMGEAHQAYLQARYDALKPNPLFQDLQHTTDLNEIAEWAPLVAEGRTHKDVAMSRSFSGTDVDFGALTRQLIDSLDTRDNADIRYNHRVTSLRRKGAGWELTVKNNRTKETLEVEARFVFVGAGGGALPLLQKSGIDEIKGYGGFPISGEFLRCTNEDVIARHEAKVYGQASVGAPPMSVPHLDTRYVDGHKSLMFGPYGGFSPKFLKSGSFFDLPFSVRAHNLATMLGVAKSNFDLVTYLVSELTKSRNQQMEAVRDYYPAANKADWEMITAGQRVQTMKKGPDGKAMLAFGTEVVSSADGTIAGLLGASPGASTSPSIMVGLLQRCFPGQYSGWEDKLKELIPTLGTKLNSAPDVYDDVKQRTDSALRLA